MSLMDALDQAIQKSTAKPETQPAAAKEPETPVEEVEEELEQEEQELAEEEEEVQEDEEASIEDDEEEQALSAKFKEGGSKEKPRLEKVIEDGVEREISIDDLKKGYQKASVSGKRFEEAAKMVKDAQQIQAETQQFVDLLEINPLVACYEVLGEEKTTAFFEQYRKEMNAYEQMTDLEKENFRLRKGQQLRGIKTSFANATQNEILTDEDAQAIKETLVQNVEKVVQVAGFKTNEQRQRLLSKMKAYANHKPGARTIEIAEIEMLADRVKEETQAEFKSILAGLSEDEVIEFLGGEIVEKVRKSLVNKFKNTKKAEKVNPTKKIETKKIQSGPKTKQDYENFWKNPA